jgi:hypothetical protein
VIAKHPKEAALGGVPGIRNKVRAFVDVTLQGKEPQESNKPESVNGSYIWAQAYYLLRCGFPDESLALLSEHQHSIKREDWSFPGAFKVFLTTPDRRLPRPTRDQLFNDFNASIRNNPNVDQFKYALYKLVGRFELNRKSLKVATTTEDWMWLQLSLVRESKEMEPPQEQYDLADLGKLVLKYGNDKFDNGGTRPFAWFNLLLFTAQFERVSLIGVLGIRGWTRADAEVRPSRTSIQSRSCAPTRCILRLLWRITVSFACRRAGTMPSSVSRLGLPDGLVWSRHRGTSTAVWHMVYRLLIVSQSPLRAKTRSSISPG